MGVEGCLGLEVIKLAYFIDGIVSSSWLFRLGGIVGVGVSGLGIFGLF